MQLAFTKMQGLGNDFVVLDARTQPLALSAQQFARLADRRYGVGCDQILIINPATLAPADFQYRVVNADGIDLDDFIRAGGGSALTQPSAKARSAMASSIILMFTAGRLMATVQLPSQGAGQTRPVNSGKLLVLERRTHASFH